MIEVLNESRTTEENLLKTLLSTNPEERLKAFSEMFVEMQDKILKNPWLDVFEYHELVADEQNMISKEEDATAITTDEEGHFCYLINGANVYPQEHLVTKTLKLTISEIASRKYYAVEKQKLEAIEYYISTLSNKLLDMLQYATGPGYRYSEWDRFISFFCKSHIVTFLSRIVKHLTPGYVFLMSSGTKNLFMEIAYRKRNNNALYEDLKVGKVFDHSIVLLENIPFGEIFVVEKQKVGRINQRQFIVLPADQFVFGYASYGFMLMQQISIVIPDRSKIQKIVLK